MMMMKMVMILMILQAELVDLPGDLPLDESLAARPLPLAGFSVFQIL